MYYKSLLTFAIYNKCLKKRQLTWYLLTSDHMVKFLFAISFKLLPIKRICNLGMKLLHHIKFDEIAAV